MIGFLRDVGTRLDRRDVAQGAGGAVDIKLARRQHTAFADALKKLGVTVKTLAPLAEHPDATVVGDTAIILPEAIIMARPSATGRGPEIETASTALAEHRPLMRLIPSAALDAGDVLRAGHTLFVAQTSRTNAEGIESLTEIVQPYGYDVQPVEVSDGRRLKCVCSFIPPHFIVANPASVSPSQFGRFKVVEVDAAEPLAANTFTVAGTTLIGAGNRSFEARLRELGISIRSVDVSEFQKVEAGLNGLCLLLEPRVARPVDAAPAMRFVQAAATRAATECFSPAIVHGGLVYVSGQHPVDPLTGRPVENDVEAQTAQVLRNLGEVLVASGSALPRTLKLTFYLADLKLADRVKAACVRTFGSHRPTGLIVIAKTLEPGCLIALDAIAAVADE